MTHVKEVPTLVWTRRSAAVSILLAMEEHRKEVALRLAALREARGLTQEELAREADVSNKTVSRLENGRNEPELDTLRKLAKALEVEVRDIQGEPPTPLGLGVSQLDRIESQVLALSDAISQLDEHVQEIRRELLVREREASRQSGAVAQRKRRSQRQQPR